MKANELRIGNWFEYGGGTINTVYQIVFDRREGHLINGQIPESHCNPIPLTPEILEKAGLNYNSSGFYWRHWGDNGVFILKYIEMYEKYFIEAGKGFSLVCENLHTLQNAFYLFSLGEELNINL